MSKEPKQELDVILDNGIDIKTRTLFIDRAIEYEDAEKMIRGFHILESASDAPITIVINSPGGDVYTGLALYDLFRSARSKIVTKGYGLIASMASILFLAGEDRIMAEHARFMVHSIHTWVAGSSRDLKIEAEEVKYLENRMLKIYEDRTNKEVSFWKKFDRSKYFGADECLRMQVATQVIKVGE